MRYCADCGTGHECEAETAHSGQPPEVEIARINADRDKYVARVQARIAREELDAAEDIAKTEADAEVGAAVAEAAVVAAVIESGTESDPETPPVIAGAPDPEPEPEVEPPPVADVPEPRERRASRGLGLW